jgi:hypothetical protein
MMSIVAHLLMLLLLLVAIPCLVWGAAADEEAAAAAAAHLNLEKNQLVDNNNTGFSLFHLWIAAFERNSPSCSSITQCRTTRRASERAL